MKTFFQAAVVAALVAMGALWLRQSNASDVAQDGAGAVRAILPKIRLPDGFKIELYAMAPDARHIAVSPKGGVAFVGTTGTRLYAIADADRDFAADSVRVFGAGLDMIMPNGPCFAPDGTLYVAEQNRVLAFANAEAGDETAADIVKRGALIPEEEQSHGHSARVCDIGPDDKLYVSLGQPHNVSPPEKQEIYLKTGIGGIVRFDRDGGNREVFATGLRNSVGMDFDPKDGVLWFTDNQVDGMGDLIPPGELNRAVKAGLSFGFPWFGGGDTRTEEWAEAAPPEGHVLPEVAMDAHAADLGMAFYTGQQFPEKYRGGIFSAQHGSWNRSTPIGARVMFTSLKPDGTADKTEVFAEGWLAPSGAYLGRPVDVAVLPDGSLLVSDDEAGALYRISYGS